MAKTPSETSAPTRRRESNDRVPAVENAILILKLLRDSAQPLTMSEAARQLEMNPSTCFNILRTLHHHDMVAISDAKAYSLGPALARLGSAVELHQQFIEEATRLVSSLATTIGLTAALLQVEPDHSYSVLVRAEDTSTPVRVTCSDNERFPANAPVLAKAHWAHLPTERVHSLVIEHGLKDYTVDTVTSESQLNDELAKVRAQRYATSTGEYYPDNSAIAAAVFNSEGVVTHLLMVIGFSAQFSEARMREWGEAVADVADQLTRIQAGERPE